MSKNLKVWMGLKPTSESTNTWYGVKAHWHKIPKYLVLALAVLWLLGKI